MKNLFFTLVASLLLFSCGGNKEGAHVKVAKEFTEAVAVLDFETAK